VRIHPLAPANAADRPKSAEFSANDTGLVLGVPDWAPQLEADRSSKSLRAATNKKTGGGGDRGILPLAISNPQPEKAVPHNTSLPLGLLIMSSDLARRSAANAEAETSQIISNVHDLARVLSISACNNILL
jgi:hypothetical protein